tara:strand:- start:8250 stop:8933 length:684 start_codon:yes stop_codon:yes gene_type:complete
MKFFFEKYKIFLSAFILFSVCILFLFYNALKPSRVLPIYQPAELSFELVDSTLQHIKIKHRVADFNLTNQNGKSISQEDYKNKIVVVDFFFTTCPSICPVMTNNMRLIQNKIKVEDNVKLLSFSVTPEIDSVPQLKKYAIEKGILDAHWNLLTGDKKEIYALARKSYFVVKEDGDGGPFDMIHTENFVLVDPDRRIRGYYDGTNEKEIEILWSDIQVLKNEYTKGSD